MKKASNEYGLPMNIQLFADGADAIADQPGEDSSQTAQEATGQAKTYTEEETSSLRSIEPYSSAWRVRSATRKSALKRRVQKDAARLKSWRRCRRNSGPEPPAI